MIWGGKTWPITSLFPFDPWVLFCGTYSYLLLPSQPQNWSSTTFFWHSFQQSGVFWPPDSTGNLLKGRNVVFQSCWWYGWEEQALRRLALILWTISHVTCLRPVWIMDKNKLGARFYGKQNFPSYSCGVLSHIQGRQDFS